ncbi:hypothetical protein BDV26DRAFT_291157 [Aspergillus bertholletiae]|uniref:Uncharacterized protein n=1 Tax=Aspergillus bertholletiae TaxID=1226010 RepID=A0A5N7BCR3_9EURO|nr:hypothetical protein BDV26DRAFT_291157 [Aspergillus bertholletiae]
MTSISRNYEALKLPIGHPFQGAIFGLLRQLCYARPLGEDLTPRELYYVSSQISTLTWHRVGNAHHGILRTFVNRGELELPFSLPNPTPEFIYFSILAWKDRSGHFEAKLAGFAHNYYNEIMITLIMLRRYSLLEFQETLIIRIEEGRLHMWNKATEWGRDYRKPTSAFYCNRFIIYVAWHRGSIN